MKYMNDKKRMYRGLLIVAAGLLIAGCAGESVSTASWSHFMNRGSAAWAKGDYQSANSNYTAALTEAGQFATNSPRLITTLENLARVRAELLHVDDAEALIKRRLDVAQALQWTNTPEYVGALEFLSDTQVRLGKLDEAEQSILRAESVLNFRLRRASPVLGLLIAKRANIYAMQSRFAEADAAFDKARGELQTLERVLPPTTAQHGWVLSALGDFFDDYGRFKISQMKYAEAETLLRQSVEYLESQHGGQSGTLVYPLIHLAAARAGQSKFQEGEKAVRRSLAILDKKGLTRHPAYALAQKTLAAILDHKIPE
jgi:tetratricopeptide (TPR) repeat protein